MIHRFLTKHFSIELSDDPDYVLDGGLGENHLDFDCIKILQVGENVVPDFNCFDYAIGFDFLEFGNRYIRIPLHVFCDGYSSLSTETRMVDADSVLNREFCSFVVSNGAGGDPIRTEFFHRLSKYKPVASGGRYLNSVGGPVPDKLEFCRKYKFNIAFENSSSPGYTTEKLMEPLSIQTCPIYWGNPKVFEDFRPDCMVHVKDAKSIDQAIEEVVYLDTHDDEYLKKLAAPCLVKSPEKTEQELVDFFKHIFSQEYEEARRLNKYGWQPVIRAQRKKLQDIYRTLSTIKNAPRRLMGHMRSLFRK
jgi:hypothetical protein